MMEREGRRLEGLGKLGFEFRSTQEPRDEDRNQADEADMFLDAEVRDLFVGAQRLDDYLREAALS
jgi:hypothetical protein